MFSFSVDVFVNNPQSLQAHLRRHTPAPTPENPQATKGDEKPFALFNVHFGQGATADSAEAMILIYDEAVCPQSSLGELSSKLNDIVVNHMKKKLAGILFLSRLEPTLANEGAPPKGFGISRTADSGNSQRYVLVEADEKGPTTKEPSALIDIFFPAANQISMTMLTMDKRLYGEQAEFLTIYTRESHPTDGWRQASNDRVGITLRQPGAIREGTASLLPTLPDGTRPSLRAQAERKTSISAVASKIHIRGIEGPCVRPPARAGMTR